MKKLLVAASLSVFSLVCFAQHSQPAKIYVYSPRVVYGLGAYAPFYPSYGMAFSPFYPYAPYAQPPRPSKLSLQIEDIRNDYHDKIRSAKSDKSLSKEERKSIVKQLKTERDQAIEDLKKNYYKH